MNKIENARRFVVIETGVIVAIYDTNRSFTKYAAICGENEIDLSTVRTYFDDELEEL